VNTPTDKELDERTLWLMRTALDRERRYKARRLLRYATLMLAAYLFAWAICIAALIISEVR
jgi:hypothetical protein